MTNLIPSKFELGATETRQRAGKLEMMEHLRGEHEVGRALEDEGQGREARKQTGAVRPRGQSSAETERGG